MRITAPCEDETMRESPEPTRAELEARIQDLQVELEELQAASREFKAKIEGAFPNLVDELMARQREKGAPLTPDETSRYIAETKERAEAIAAGFKRLQELGIDADRLAEIASPGPDAILERIRAAIDELENPRHS